jgi:hypothetical protein
VKATQVILIHYWQSLKGFIVFLQLLPLSLPLNWVR